MNTQDSVRSRHGAPIQLEKLDIDTERSKKKSPGKSKTKRQPSSKQTRQGKAAPSKASPNKVAVMKSAITPIKSGSIPTKSNTASQKKTVEHSAKLRPASAPVVAVEVPRTRPNRATLHSASPSKRAIGNTATTDDATSNSIQVKASAWEETTPEEPTPIPTGGPEAAIAAAKFDDLPKLGMYHELVETRECETLCANLGLTISQLRQIKRKFDANDMYHTGEITQAELFFILNEHERPLTQGILKYADISLDQKFIHFDEYLRCVVSFSALTPRELHQFVFDLYDADQSGALDDKEFAKMSREMQSKQFSFRKNVAHAIGKITTGDYRTSKSADGLVDAEDFMNFARLCPVAFYPILNFQKNVRRATLGEAAWSHLVGRKRKVQELVEYMRSNHGTQPEMTWRDHLWNTLSNDLRFIRHRAAEIYAAEIQRGNALYREQVQSSN